MFDLFKQIWANRREATPTESSAHRGIEVGSARFLMPQGWRVKKRNDEICILCSADNLQQATVSLMRLKSSPDFDVFKALCDKRVAAEKQDLGDGFIEAQAPATSQGVFNMSFSGADKKNGRIFSGCLMLAKTELYTIYLESAGVSAQQHLDSFASLVSRFKTK
jgi:hypothetical protein